MSNVPSVFSKSVCTYNFFCATFHQDSSVFGTTCMKHVQRHFLKENLCALQVYLCALVLRLVCARAQLRGNIDLNRIPVHFENRTASYKITANDLPKPL